MKTKLKATPGPWKFIDVIGGCVVWAGKIQLLEYSHSPDEENRANARLAASAPDLYAALEGMLEVHGVTQEYADKHIGIPQSWVEVSEIARAALAKARGEQ